MKRHSSQEIVELLACPECHGGLTANELVLECVSCHEKFSRFRNRPLLLSAGNELFSVADYANSEAGGDSPGTHRTGILGSIKRLVPKVSVNLAREEALNRIAAEHGRRGKTILVVGCGNQVQQLERKFADDTTVFVFCDIDSKADADVFCDSHELSFKDSTFDGAVSTAVLEHVLYPERVIAEIHRVLKDGGFLYSEIPFLQSVHEGAYDFTRYTLSGHRRLLEYFTETASGMVAGPGTALAWSLVDFFRGLSKNARISSAMGLLARVLFFWLKYFDYLMRSNPLALNAASCTYFYGVKVEDRISAGEIVSKYEGQAFTHT